MPVNWQMLTQYADPGQAVQQGFSQGYQFGQHIKAQNALSSYIANPDQPLGANALAGLDPRTAMAIVSDQRQRAALSRRQSAGSLYASGDKVGAQKAALAGGDFDLATAFLNLDEAGQKAALARTRAAAPVLIAAGKRPYEERKAVIEGAKQSLLAQGWTPEEIDAFDPTDENIEGLAASVMTVEQALDSGKVKWVTGDWGAFATDAYGHPVRPGFVGDPSQQQPAPGQTPQAPASVPAATDPVFEALIQQESGGQAGILGPQTQYGRAVGMTQMLPATAQEMAGKLGLPYDSNLLSGTTPEAADYQRKLGRAYLEEGLQKYGGDVEKALMYYHGGPNEALWGPKTRAYARDVMARSGQSGEAPRPAPETVSGMSFADDGLSLQEQAASGVIRPREKPPSGYIEGPNNTLIPKPGGPGDKTVEREDKRIDRVTSLRKEFNDDRTVKDFNIVRNSVKEMQTLAKIPDNDPSRAQADIALVFSFMRALDPNSTVREGEFATAQNSAGVPERVRIQYNKALNGELLSPKQRNGFVATAQEKYRALAGSYNEKAQQYHSYFRDLGVKDPRPYAPIATPPPRTYKRTGGQAKPTLPAGWSIERVD